jgi:POT family proton-dependent oligopeptide transporter
MNDTKSIEQYDKKFFGHPMGLFVLFFAEMWERFSYYGMRALLVLYMASSFDDGGLGWTNKSALELYGWYTMLVYVMSIPGGILADKYIGQKKSVLVGGLILCVGHGILAIDASWAFFTGLFLIVLGVGALKPNISTMVGQLYKPGDVRRDKGFTLFYIGINVGALLAGVIVGTVGQSPNWGWHYGFGLAGIGMLLGQAFFMWGGKYLVGIGEKVEAKSDDVTIGQLFGNLLKSKLQLAITIAIIAFSVYFGATSSIGYGLLFTFIALVTGMMMMVYKDLSNKVDKDRFVVLLLSFLIVIVFWGAFEQAGGLLNLYADEKINRVLLGFEIPASWFQSVNALFIILFGSIVAAFWAKRQLKGKEASTLLKMGLGIIIMGAGFLLMAAASNEASQGAYGTASLWWLVGAYFLHTIGELFASPTALSFITKLAPIKYASLMMGVYFAATGLGNKVAGAIGEASQSEPIGIELVADKSSVYPFISSDTIIAKDMGFAIKSNLYLTDNSFEATDMKNGDNVLPLFDYSVSASKEDSVDKTDEQISELIASKKEEKQNEIINILKENNATKENPYHATFKFSKDQEAKKVKANKGDCKNYNGAFIIEEVQSEKEFNIFVFIFGLTLIFGLLVILLLKKLKALTHGAEDNESTTANDKLTEGFELADEDL